MDTKSPVKVACMFLFSLLFMTPCFISPHVCIACYSARAQTPLSQDRAQELEQIRKQASDLGAKQDFNGSLERYTTGWKKALEYQDKFWTGRFLANMGVMHFYLSQYKEAKQRYLEGLHYLEKAHREDLQAIVLLNVSTTCVALKQYEEAIDYQLKALALDEKAQQKDRVLFDLSQMDALYFMTGHFDKGLAEPSYFDHALIQRKQFGSQVDVARSLYNLAVAHTAVGHEELGLSFYLRAIPGLLAAKDQRRAGAAYSDIGSLYYRQGAQDKAEGYLRKARATFEEGHYDDDLADALEAMAIQALSLSHLKEAAQWIEQASQLRKKAGKEENLTTINLQVALLLARGKTLQAEIHLQKRLAAYHPVKPEHAVGEAHNLLGRIAFQSSHFAQAQSHYEEALHQFEPIGDRLKSAQVYLALAEIYVQNREFPKAEDAFRDAIERFEKAEFAVSEPSRIGLYQDLYQNHLYARYALLLAAQGRPEEALEQVERGKMRGLARQAALNNASLRHALEQASPEWKAAWEKYQAVERFLNNPPFFDLKDSRHREAYSITRANAPLVRDQALAELTALQAKICTQQPSLRRRLGRESTDRTHLMRSVRDHKDTLYLEWAVIDDNHILLFAVSADGIKAIPLSYGKRLLTPLIADWRDCIEAGHKEKEGYDTPERQRERPKKAAREKSASQALYRLLMDPLEKQRILGPKASQAYRRLALIPDGPLLDIPFAALSDASHTRLIERYSIRYGFTISASFEKEETFQTTGNLFYLADPFPFLVSRKLPAIRMAVQTIEKFCSKNTGFYGPEAQKNRVLAQKGKYAMLLLGTHANLEPHNKKIALNPVNGKITDAMDSYLALAPSGKEKDDRLTAREIAAQSFNAQIVVLAACQSGNGEARGGDGLVGLSWAFRAAGCPSIVATQWDVEDRATGLFLIALFKSLILQKRPSDEAVRQASLAVLHTPGFNSPYYWSAFLLVGEAKLINLLRVSK